MYSWASGRGICCLYYSHECWTWQCWVNGWTQWPWRSFPTQTILWFSGIYFSEKSMLGKPEMPSGFAFGSGWLWMSRARTEQPYGTSYTLVIICEERERSSTFQLEKWVSKIKEQSSLQISLHLVQVQAFLALWGSGWSPSSVQASVSPARHICQDSTWWQVPGALGRIGFGLLTLQFG